MTPESKWIELRDAAGVDLNKHAVIEASAGTGKTYTIEKLVVRILLETDAKLNEILLVTFTDKAAGELKDRVRRAIESALHDQANTKLRTALEEFEQATISTIHGFCKAVLQQYAFENGQPFNLEMCDGTEALIQLRELQRQVWPKDFGNELPKLLRLSGYPGAIQEDSRWESEILKLASSFREKCGEQMRPEPAADLAACVRVLETQTQSVIERLKHLVGLNIEKPEESAFVHQYSRLNYLKSTRDARIRIIVVPLMKWMADRDSAVFNLAGLFDACAERDDFVRNGFESLKDFKFLKSGPNPQDCPGLDKVIELLKTLEQIHRQTMNLAAQFKAYTVRKLQQMIEAYKAERGLYSFDDMLSRVEAALTEKAKGAERLLGALRNRYKYAIVDEFQDTDRVQWNIFQRIFVEGKSQRLVLIGDPKQAIYSFRNADVHTYLHARNTLHTKFGAELYRLSTNWRSDAKLISALNHLFERSDWFPTQGGIEFSAANCPEPDKQRAIVYRDSTGRQPLTIVDLSKHEPLSRCKVAMAEYIADEISRLLTKENGQSRLVFQSRHGLESLQEKHICVLVRKKKDAKQIEDALSARRIPFTYYKKTGLWQSDEALNLSFLLKAIADADDSKALKKALLTPFFPVRKKGEISFRRIAIRDLSHFDDIPPSHRIKLLFESWRSCCAERQWGRLFQSILEDTGMIYDEIRQTDGERRLTNYHQISQALESAAHKDNLDIFGLTELLDSKRRTEVFADEDEDLHRIESDESKVQIITTHKSKGLEFPIVFVAGDFTQPKPPSNHRYHDQQNVVYDLTCADATRALHEQEEIAEMRRLYYVALTRAMYKLYFPIVRPRENSRARPGPQAIFLQSAVANSRIGDADNVQLSEDQIARTPDLTWKAELAPLPRDVKAPPEVPLAIPNPLFPTAPGDFRDRSIRIHSFTSLSRALHAHYPDVALRTDDDIVRTESSHVDELPFGAATGELLHYILENADYEAIKAATNEHQLQTDRSFNCLIDEALANFPLNWSNASRKSPAFERHQRELIANIVWNTLHTPLSILGCRLCDIPRHSRIHELEFHAPRSAKTDDLLTGFIDLVFRIGEKFYVLDWKSNAAAPYDSTALEKCMREHDYHRQYALYAHVLSRWIKRSVKDYDCSKHFGGVFYLFLRGLNGVNDSTGVFFARPSVDFDVSEEVVSTWPQ